MKSSFSTIQKRIWTGLCQAHACCWELYHVVSPDKELCPDSMCCLSTECIVYAMYRQLVSHSAAYSDIFSPISSYMPERVVSAARSCFPDLGKVWWGASGLLCWWLNNLSTVVLALYVVAIVVYHSILEGIALGAHNLFTTSLKRTMIIHLPCSSMSLAWVPSLVLESLKVCLY